MNQWWQYWPGKLSPAFCSDLITRALTIDPDPGKVGSLENQRQDEKIRRSVIRWLPKSDVRFSGLFHIIEKTVNEGNKNAFGFDLSYFNDVQFTEYDAMYEGHYTWHQDTVWGANTFHQRKLSLVIQLSNPDSYTGGDLEFLKEDCIHLPKYEDIRKQGTIILFPSFLKHRVTSVTSGKRYSLVTWIEGPNFR